jgi:hypothetical protein
MINLNVDPRTTRLTHIRSLVVVNAAARIRSTPVDRVIGARGVLKE